MTTEATLAALRLSDQLGPTLVRKLIDVSVRIRARETLFRDDEIVGEGAYALKDAEADRDMLRDALAALVAEASATPDAVGKWHALEDARQALAQVGGPNVAIKPRRQASA